MAQILITGAQSFIGTNYREFSKFKNIDEISLIDIRPEDINFSKYDVVLHLAAIVHQSKNIPQQEYFYINRDLCINVAKQAKIAGVKQFIFLSTIKVYGKFISGSDPWNENSNCIPGDSYSESKYEAEIALRNLENKNFIVSIIRTPVVYGPGVKANMLKLIRLVENIPILPFGKINNNRHYTYIENLIGFIDRTIELSASGIFIAMDDNGLSTTEIVSYLSKYLNRKIFLFRLPDIFLRLAFTIKLKAFDRLYGSFYLDNSKTKELLNYKPHFSNEDGLRKWISFYLKGKKSKNT